MSKKLTIVARIEANVDKVELVKAELLKLRCPNVRGSWLYSVRLTSGQ